VFSAVCTEYKNNVSMIVMHVVLQFSDTVSWATGWASGL